MIRCPACGEENSERARFCQACGTPLDEASSREERRVVSVLFVDLVGFTSKSEQLDPEDVRAMLTRYYERARAEIERFGGTVEKFIGDAVMAVFGAPVAYGDDAERAVRAAMAVRDSIADMDEADPLLELQVRAAVNTGEAIVELGAAARRPASRWSPGDVVNTAARLQSNAPVDSVLVGQETYSSTRTVIEYREVEAITAKGKVDPVPAWIAVAPLVAAGERVFSEVPIVGRGEELAALRGMWDIVVVRAPMLAAHGLRAGRDRQVAARARARAPGDGVRRARAARPIGRVRRHRPVQRVRAARGTGSPASTTATTRPTRSASCGRRRSSSSVGEDPDEVADAVAILAGPARRERTAPIARRSTSRRGSSSRRSPGIARR